MKPFSLFKTCAAALSVVALAALLTPLGALATGPRVSPSVFVSVENEIFAADQQPFISTAGVEAGLVTDIASAVLKAAEVDALITTLPLRSMVKYHLTQEQAIAALGSRFTFSPAERDALVFVPLFVSPTYHLYYRPAHDKVLSWDGELKSLSGLRYGALKGEDASAYEKAGVKVVFGSERSLLKKLKSGDVDFIRLTPLAEAWLLDRHHPDDKTDFARMPHPAGVEIFSMIFNPQHKNAKAVAASAKGVLETMVRDGRYGTILNGHLGAVDVVDRYVDLLRKNASR